MVIAIGKTGSTPAKRFLNVLMYARHNWIYRGRAGRFSFRQNP